MPMNTPWETDTTAKVSEAQRMLFYNDVGRRQQKLLTLLDRVLQYTYSSTPTEREAFEEDTVMTDPVLFPLEDEDHPAGSWGEEREADRHENAGEDDGAEGGAGTQIQECSERDVIAMAIYQCLDMPAGDRTKFSLPWKDTFPGKLEMLLNHLDEHRCHLSAASEGQGSQAEGTNRRRAFINLELVSFLQLEMEEAHGFISNPHLRSNISSGHRIRHNAFRARTAFRDGRGPSSPLVESFTPDQMPMSEPRHVRAHDPFQLWAPLFVWGPQILPETSTEISAAGGSEDPGEEDEIL